MGPYHGGGEPSGPGPWHIYTARPAATNKAPQLELEPETPTRTRTRSDVWNVVEFWEIVWKRPYKVVARAVRKHSVLWPSQELRRHLGVVDAPRRGSKKQ